MSTFLGRKDSWKKLKKVKKQAKAVKFEQLADSPHQYYSKPIITNEDVILLPADKEFIYQYISNINEWMIYCKYPHIISGHSMCFDKITQQLVIYDGKGKIIKISSNNSNNSNNLHVHESQIININNVNTKTKDHCLCFIFPENIINLVGGFQNNIHFVSSDGGNSFKEIYKFSSITNGIIGHAIIKLKKRNKLLMLGGWDYFDNSQNKNGTLFDIIHQFDANTQRWKQLTNVFMPYKMCGFGYVLSLNERFVVIFGGQKQAKKITYLNEIFYLDLNTMEWTKSALKCPKKSGYHAIIRQNGNIHLFERVPNWKCGHYVINIKCIVPELNQGDEMKQDMKLWQDIIDNKVNEIERLQQINNAQKKEIDALKMRLKGEKKIISENELLKCQINEMKMRNNNLNEECKEFEIKYNKLKVKYNYNVMSAKRLNICDYMNWDYVDIVDWICNLENKRFTKYREKLLIALKDENMDGMCLSGIEKNDLHRFGVHDFKDKASLIQKIRALNNNNNNIYGDDDDILQYEGRNNTQNAQTPYIAH